MLTLKRLSNVMEHPTVYRVWQAPFAAAKFEPVRRHNDLTQVRRILDVGCGPGTNVPMFPAGDYVGLDFNRRYIEMAKARYPGKFVVADARSYQVSEESQFDFILLNSLFHHIDTDNVQQILASLSGQLTNDGHIHILDLVLPDRPCVARYLARSDRGDFPRPLSQWRTLFEESFETVVFESYDVGWLGTSFWNMVYFKGRPKS